MCESCEQCKYCNKVSKYYRYKEDDNVCEKHLFTK